MAQDNTRSIDERSYRYLNTYIYIDILYHIHLLYRSLYSSGQLVGSLDFFASGRQLNASLGQLLHSIVGKVAGRAHE